MTEENDIREQNGEKCAFCGRDGEDCGQLIASTKNPAIAICEECTQQAMFVHIRVGELKQVALANFIKAKAIDERRDEDGDCQCPNCGLAKLMKNDPIIAALRKGMGRLSAEEVIPAGTVIQ